MIWDALSDIDNLGAVVSASISKTLSPHKLDELNYLAAKIQALRPSEFETFAAAVQAGRHCENVAEIINITENLDRFNIQPGYSEEQYGDFLLDMEKDTTRAVFERLEKSNDPDERYFAQYVLRLETFVDEEAFGKNAVELENGVFTKHGYLTESEGFKEVYRGPQDIPAEHRLFSKSGEIFKPLIKTVGTDIATAVVKLCAVSGDHIVDGAAAGILKNITAGKDRDYLLTINTNGIHFYPAMDAYKQHSGHAGVISSLTGEESTRFFALHITELNNGIKGNLVELNKAAFNKNTARHCISPDRVDATMNDGSKRSYDLWSWADLPIPYRSQIAGYELHYSEDNIKKAYLRFDYFRDTCADECKTVSETELLMEINSAYMSAAENSQPDMLRITNEAAKEILARGDADVYRLTPSGTEKLAPIEAARSMCFAEHRDLAIKREDVAGLDKWAKRAANKIIQQNERGERDKGKNREEI